MNPQVLEHKEALLSSSPTYNIQMAFLKHFPKFGGGGEGDYNNITVSISGGADSDRMLDMIERIGYQSGNVSYVYFNTGMEYQATKDHLQYLREKYNVEIKEYRAKCPVPLAVRRYGYPFLSKKISNYIHRLQIHGFQWEDESFDVLYARYPKCKAALRWWCNEWGERSLINISNRKWLKEFMVQNPPTFPISDQCCQKAKKDTAHEIEKELSPDLTVNGVRKTEGGVRRFAYQNCFDHIQYGCSRLRPLFWFTKEDCDAYDHTFHVEHSKCYTQYGLDRTGCACCPFGKHFEKELAVAERFEPKLFKAAMNVFGPSIEYTRKYQEFKKEMELKHGRQAEG